VSTQRQGQQGTSLAEQQAAIERFAETWNLPIVRRFEERETAAKQGRPVFLNMLKQLKTSKANGVIIHKIDRSARNLKDWADLGSLIDSGIEVHFASEGLDLSSRGGRLSADIQAVVASDYIRNLKEETKKGLYGRLRQGLYPFRAVIGYLDQGKGQPKKIDPIKGPLIQKAFEMYATGDWGLIALTEELNNLGLRNKVGNRTSLNGLATILHNPFYIGVIRIEKTGETFTGIHRPIISKSLYDQVQDVFAGKNIKKETRHFFVYRRTVQCRNCRRFLTAEIQKGHTYYRCRTKNCLFRCLREDEISGAVLESLNKIEFSESEYRLLRELSKNETYNVEKESASARKDVKLQQDQIRDRHSRLAHAFIEGIFDRTTYLQKKNELVLEEHALREKLANLQTSEADVGARLDEFCELANSAHLSYKTALPTDQRDLVKIITANLMTDGKSVFVKMKNPFQLIADRHSFTVGSPYREATRTIEALFKGLLKYFKDPANSKDDDELVNYLNSKKPEKSKSNNYHFLQKPRPNNIC